LASGSLGVLAACRAPLPAALRQEGTPTECPARLRDQLRLSASALPLSLPEGMAVEPGSGRPEELLARRLLIASSPAGAAAGIPIAASTLTITVVGGTFGGSVSTSTGSPDGPGAARLAAPRELSTNRALEIIPGQLRIAPFFTSPRLGAQTLALDVTVVPGGIPRPKAITSLSRLWTPSGQPVAPADAGVTVTTGQHLTIFSAVEAQVQLDVDGVDRSDPRLPWRCSYEAHFTLLDHAAVLPSLWTLQLFAPGRPPRALALLTPATGPFRAIFSDAAAAQAFATWLRATSATRAGGYQLGLFEAGEGTQESPIPDDRDIAHTFRTATSEELGMLAVRRLGED